MEPRVFRKFCAIAHQKAGIHLKPGKEALVSARVAKRLRVLHLPNEQAYLEYLENDESGEELISFLDVISTNFTSFMREREHFHSLIEYVTENTPCSGSQFKLWCAAASSGEEPYTIAVTLSDVLPNGSSGFRLLATDISTNVLGKAIEGVYRKEAVEPLTAEQRRKYFIKQADNTYQVIPELKEPIVFRRLNLSTPPFPMNGPLDIVFCRNVMIYFDHKTRQALISEIERLLTPGGVLYTGHSETLAGIDTGLKMLKPSIYRKPKAISNSWKEAV